MVKGKHVYREACDQNRCWDAEFSKVLARDWLKWTTQPRGVQIPRSVIREFGKVKGVHLHLFADASNLACCATTVTVVEQDTETVKGLLTTKSRISKRYTSIARLGAREKSSQCFKETAHWTNYHFNGQSRCPLLDLDGIGDLRREISRRDSRIYGKKLNRTNGITC